MKSRPWVNAKAHSDGDETSEIEMSLKLCQQVLPPYSDGGCSPSLCHLLADVYRLGKNSQPGLLCAIHIALLCT